MPNMSAPYIAWYNGTSIVEFMKYPNVVTGGLFWPMMLLVLAIILFSSFRIFGSKAEESFAITSWIMLIVTIFAGVLEFVDPSICLIPIVLSMVSILILYKKDGN